MHSLENKLCNKTEILIVYLMTYFADLRKKNHCLTLFVLNYKWTIELTVQTSKSNACLDTDGGNLQEPSLFHSSSENYEKYASDVCIQVLPFWSNNSQLEWIINEIFAHGTWKQDWYRRKQTDLPCRPALLACRCDCCFSVTASVHVTVHTSDPLLSHISALLLRHIQ